MSCSQSFLILLLNNKLDAALVKMNRPAQETDFLQEKFFFKKCIVTQLLVTKVSVNMLIVSSLPVFNLLSHTLVLISSANKTWQDNIQLIELSQVSLWVSLLGRQEVIYNQ